MQPENLPEQTTGLQTNTEHTITVATRNEALKIFKQACKKLLNVNAWHKVSGKASADFNLINPQGEKEHSPAKVNDYFKIDIPGPGSAAGEGYDWVRVEKIEDRSGEENEDESLMMQVRPCGNPDNKTNDTAHFLSGDATSTFIVRRQNNTITADVYGRNEMPNTGTKNIIDKVRNAVIGTAAVAGASKVQWALLVKGLLADEAD